MITLRLIILLTSIMLLSSYHPGVYANDSHPHHDIEKTANQYITQQVGDLPKGQLNVKVGKLDPRLRLAKCDTELEAYLPPGRSASNSSTVGIRCLGSQPWSIYVPVKSKIMLDVMVAAHPISRGTVLQKANLQPASRNLNRLTTGYFESHEQLIGKVAKQPIPQGMPITPNKLQAQVIVKRGTPVKIMAKTGVIVVHMQGVALMDGSMGDLIKVKNKDSQRIVDAVISSPNTVDVYL